MRTIKGQSELMVVTLSAVLTPGMSRWRFNGGRMTRQHMQFLADSIRKYNLQHVHFTTGQCLQMQWP